MTFDLAKAKAIVRRLNVLDWILWFGLGGWGLHDFLTAGNPIGGLHAVLFLSAGFFQLSAHRWAWQVGLAAWSVFTVFVFFVGLERGFTAWRIATCLALVWGIWMHVRERPRYRALTREAARERAEAGPDNGPDAGDADDDAGGPRHSLVLLLGEPLYLDASILGQLAARAYGLPFNDGDEAENFVVGGEGKPHLLRVHGAMFLIHHQPRPYFDDAEAVAEGFRELRRAEAVRRHRAWFSVDFLPASRDLPDAQIHDTLGRLLAEVAATGAEILAVCHPASRRLVPWEPAFRELLSGDDPLAVFQHSPVPVMRVDADSPALIAAVAEARRRWPEFLAAYAQAADKAPFSVKAPVTEGGRTEFIWIKVKTIAGDQIHGLLANDPVALGELKLGSFVSVQVAELNDWVCPDPAAPDRPLGLFTVKAVQAAQHA
jgi:uncharacterized protein YegJ (DUF2314 family)